MAVFLFNYDCEFEWAGAKPEKARNKHPWHLLNRQSLLMWPLMSPGDQLAVYQTPDPSWVAPLAQRLGFEPRWLVVEQEETNRVALDLAGQIKPGETKIVPWGLSPSVARLQGVELDPTQAKFSSKLFFNQLRPAELAPRNAVLDDPDWVEPRLKQGLKDWGEVMVKHPWGSSGKRNLRLSRLSPKSLTLIRRWVVQAGGVLLEQVQPIEQEWSLQYQFEESGPRLLGLTRLYVGKDGSHQGSGVGLSPPRPLKEVLPRVETMLWAYHQEGFRGPLGLDLRLVEGQFYLGEVNARLTMGRLALEWSRIFKTPGRLVVEPAKSGSEGFVVNQAVNDSLGRHWTTRFVPHVIDG